MADDVRSEARCCVVESAPETVVCMECHTRAPAAATGVRSAEESTTAGCLRERASEWADRQAGNMKTGCGAEEFKCCEECWREGWASVKLKRSGGEW